MTNRSSMPKSEIDYTNLPYRRGVGMVILNRENKIFVARRIDSKSPTSWQMPQGGIDTGETPSAAARREMLEEIGCNNCEIICESKFWYSYSINKELIPKLWNGNYRGQKQKWFLMRFLGSDEDINVATQNPEFGSWKWTNVEEIKFITSRFKRNLYKMVLKEFYPMIYKVKTRV